jgi:hypothetical protein
MFLNFFKKKEDKHDAKKIPEPMISMVTLNEACLPNIKQIEKYLASTNLENVILENIDENDTVTMFNLFGERFFYSLMPAPIPWEELEGPCTTAWYWPEATELMSRQTSHIIISILPNTSSILTQVERATLLSRITAAILFNTNSIGVYWGAGTVVSSKEVFMEKINNMDIDNLPFELWIDLRLQRTKSGGCQFFTTGMKSFGHREIEIRDSKMNGNDISSFMYNIIAYLLEKGPVIKDGDTIGGDENEKIKVRYDKSMWNVKEDVMVVEC